MSEKSSPLIEVVDHEEINEVKREFIKKFGKYAASAPAAMFILMSPMTSKAAGSDVSQQSDTGRSNSQNSGSGSIGSGTSIFQSGYSNSSYSAYENPNRD